MSGGHGFAASGTAPSAPIIARSTAAQWAQLAWRLRKRLLRRRLRRQSGLLVERFLQPLLGRAVVRQVSQPPEQRQAAQRERKGGRDRVHKRAFLEASREEQLEERLRLV